MRIVFEDRPDLPPVPPLSLSPDEHVPTAVAGHIVREVRPKDRKHFAVVYAPDGRGRGTVANIKGEDLRFRIERPEESDR